MVVSWIEKKDLFQGKMKLIDILHYCIAIELLLLTDPIFFFLSFEFFSWSIRATPKVCQILLGKSCVLPTCKKVKKRVYLQ
jgi:hypothetical protein